MAGEAEEDRADIECPLEQNLAENAQVGELRIPGGTLVVMLAPSPRMTGRGLYERGIGVLIWLALQGLVSALFMPVVNWLVTNFFFGGCCRSRLCGYWP